jgi:hypothetical protein
MMLGVLLYPPEIEEILPTYCRNEALMLPFIIECLTRLPTGRLDQSETLGKQQP